MLSLCFAGAGWRRGSVGLGWEVVGSARLFSWCAVGDGGGGGEVPAGDGGGAEPVGGVLGLHRHLQQGPHELARLQLWYEIQSCPRCLAPC